MSAGDVGWYLLLVGAGLIAGIVNSIAGGGSFLTLPALMLFGLDPKLANGTNRLAVLFSSASAVATFQKHGHLNKRMVVRVGVPTLLGVPFGSLLAVHLSVDAFRGVFGILFLVMAAIILMDPKRLTGRELDRETSVWKLSPIFLLIGVYVGFMQAGVGILLLVAMSWVQSGDLIASNAVKNSVVFIVTLVATLVFVLYGLVEWVPGLVMACGNVVGGVVGARLAIKKGNRLVFSFLVFVMVGTGVKMLFDAFV
ncbi:MAG: sulfite exporter TauE/SafE family protein [Rubripirellula sp.]